MNREQMLSFITALAVANNLDANEIAKSITPPQANEESDLVKFAKGAITPTDLAVSGEISATRANKFIDLIQKNNQFLSKITVIPMESLKTTYDVWDMERGILVRVDEGQEPTEAQKKKIQNKGRKLEAKAVQLFTDVLRATILNNLHRPNLTAWLDGKFSIKFGNELVYLGFVGVADDYANEEFKELNKGWIQVAKDEDATNKDTYAADSTMVDRLKALVDNADDELPDNAKILIHRKDFINYCIEVGIETNSSALLIQAAAEGFGGYAFEITNNMPSGTYMLSPLENLVLGVVGKIYRAREFNSRKRAIEYTFDFYPDYDVAVPRFVSLMQPE
jgi:hypothetical protein